MEGAQMATQRKVDGGARTQITASAKDMWHQAIVAAEIAEKTAAGMELLYSKGVISEQKRYPMSVSVPRFPARHSGI